MNTTELIDAICSIVSKKTSPVADQLANVRYEVTQLFFDSNLRIVTETHLSDIVSERDRLRAEIQENVEEKDKSLSADLSCGKECYVVRGTVQGAFWLTRKFVSPRHYHTLEQARLSAEEDAKRMNSGHAEVGVFKQHVSDDGMTWCDCE